MEQYDIFCLNASDRSDGAKPKYYLQKDYINDAENS